MPFLDVTFPLSIVTEIGMSGTIEPPPVSVASTADGKIEQRIAVTSTGRYIARLTAQGRTLAQMQQLFEFMSRVKGGFYSFKFKDPESYFNTATGQSLGNGDGVETDYQLIRSFDLYDHKITKPTSGTTVVYIDGVVQTSRVSVSPTTGIVSFTPAFSIAIGNTATGGGLTTMFCDASSLSSGDSAYFSGFTGDWTALNGQRFIITKLSPSYIQIGFDSTGFTTCPSGCGQIDSLPQVGEEITVDFDYMFQCRFMNPINSTRIAPGIAEMMGEITVVEVDEA